MVGLRAGSDAIKMHGLRCNRCCIHHERHVHSIFDEVVVESWESFQPKRRFSGLTYISHLASVYMLKRRIVQKSRPGPLQTGSVSLRLKGIGIEPRIA